MISYHTKAVTTLPGYQLGQCLYEGPRTLVYQGMRLGDGASTIVKILRTPHPSFNQLVQFRNQYAIARHLQHANIVTPLALESYGNGYALIMPDSKAMALHDYWHKFNPNLEEFFVISLQLADALHYLSQEQIIHKDIKPANILICPHSKQIKLIDFSISSLLPKETQTIQTPNSLEGTLAYLSPEQTGRMNRGIDYRSDFYSLGVTLYEFLIGNLPFNSNDPLELIHAHIAQNPEPISTWVCLGGQLCPEPLSDIILKLMAKNAEDRYQSALGLKYDLKKCLKEYKKTGKIAAFTLGERDLCDRFLIPEKLYGREHEVETLLESFHRVATGESEIMLVAGFSGIGKTAVINEVHKPIVKQRGYFIKGKFDQFNRNIPFSAFVQAFRDFMGRLLRESDSALAHWKLKILAAIGENGRVLIDVIPELERIIGAQPPVPELSGSAAQNRFNLLLEKFIAVFTTKEHPLTLFLDDLQWADSASLNLLKVLMVDRQTGYLLLLGAYRDNEVFPAHPLMLTLAELQKQQTTISTITLTPLSIPHINQLVAETLSCSIELAAPLTHLIYQNTKGNPFFTTQFLKGLYEDALIEFDRNIGYWQCDLVKVQDAALTEDVVEFMARRLHKLPEETQNVLKLAACIGNRFDLETLSIICKTAFEEVAAALWGALREGLILPQSDAYKFFQDWKNGTEKSDTVTVNYRFLHDRVQQAAYSLIPPEHQSLTHYDIGYILLDKLSSSEREESIFDIVGHLNLGIELITQESQKNELARLNLIAGQKAKHATAYGSAFKYLKQGIDLLPAHPWDSLHQLTLNLHCEAMQSGYLSGNISESETLGEIVLQQVQDQLDAIEVYETKIQIYITSRQTAQAIDMGLDALAMMGMSLDDITHSDKNAIALPAIDTVPDLLKATDPYYLAKMRILTAITSAALISRPDLLFDIVSIQVLLCQDNGYSALAAFTYSWYGALLCTHSSAIDRGYQSGQLAIALLERFQEQARVEKCSIYNMVYTFIIPWKQHARDGLSYLLEGSQNGLDVGDFVYASYCLENYCAYLFLTGGELQAVSEQQSLYIELMQKIKNDYAANNMSVWRQLSANLLGQSTPITRLDGEYLDETTVEQNWQESQLGWSLFNLYLAQTMLLYSFGYWTEAITKAELAQKYAISVGAWMPIAIHNFYYSLALLASCSDASPPYQDILLLVEIQQNTLREWAQHAPMNYQHKWDLVEAERQRVLGNKAEAMDFYDRAIAGAKENKYLPEEAIANERAALFYLDWNKEKVSASYMQEAYYCYSRWGSKAKIEALEQDYPYLLTPILNQPKLSLTTNVTISTVNELTVSKNTTEAGNLLDLTTLMKASRTLSQEIELDCLLSTLMNIVIENAGATKGALLLTHETDLMIEAIAIRSNANNALQLDSLHQSIPLENYPDLPEGLINYVRRTAKTILLEAKTAQSQFATDRYFLDSPPQSLLCFPLLERGKFIGVLYLENSCTADAFNRDRIEVLDMLCAQAAISLENARLYQQSQHAFQELKNAQLQLIQNEKMVTLGNLVAGVAHEINNPVSFISGNISAAREYLQDLLDGLSLYQNNADIPSEIATKIKDLDLEFVVEDFPKLMTSMQTGCDRIHNISTSLRTFSRTDTVSKTEFDLHDGIDSTLLILKYRLKDNDERPAIEIIKKYGAIVPVQCYPGQLNQVFMNLLANAIDALEERNEVQTFTEIEKQTNQITIETQLSDDKSQVIVKVIDNGTGMPESVQSQIFEQGFTTKAVGKGTGLGMAIAHQIVVEKHSGQIACRSELGKGTEFIISVPVN